MNIPQPTTYKETGARIYVASLSDYNEGRLHGVWIDATQDVDDIEIQIQDMLASGAPGAEEYAIHDYEGFGTYNVREHESIETLHAMAVALEEHGQAFSVWVAYCDGDPTDVDSFEEQYQGRHESAKDYAEELVGEVGWNGLEPDDLEKVWSFLDFDHMAHELSLDGYYFADAGAPGYGVYVFRTY